MRTYFFVVPALLLVAAGCRPARQSQAPSEPAAAAPSIDPAQDNRPIIVAFGDSLTAGAGVDPGQSYPDFLQKELDRQGYRYRVVNEGVSGDTTTDALARAGILAQSRPAIVILEFGANDGLRGLPVDTTRANLQRLIGTVRNGPTQVVLAGITLPPNYGVEYIRTFDSVFKDLARKYSLPFIPFLLEGVAGKAEYMQRDGLHPNVEGNRRVAATVFKVLSPLLRK